MFRLISTKKLKAEFKQIYEQGRDYGYDAGIKTGYTLGFQMGKIEARNRLLLELGDRLKPDNLVNQELDQILREKGITPE